MDFLANPNVSYVLLILGFLTAILALFAPGTGLLEVGALLTLLLAGYGIVNLPINAWALAIIAVGLLLFALGFIQPRHRSFERNQRRRTLLLSAASLAFILGSALLFRGETSLLAVNPILVILLSLCGLGFTIVLANKGIEAAHALPAFDLDQLVGMTGQASSDIRGQGTVYVNGEEWTAFSRAFIPSGCSVRVLRREGLALEVEAI